MGFVMQDWGRVGHVGVGWGGSCRVGGSCRGEVGYVWWGELWWGKNPKIRVQKC